MRLVKFALIVLAVYVGLVLTVEGLVGYFQPDMEGAVVITTTDDDGNAESRTLAGFRLDDRLYVASNHWLRGWYHRAIEHPEVQITRRGTQAPYTAVPVTGEERERLAEAYQMGFVLRLLCGFAPSRFLRLDPLPAP